MEQIRVAILEDHDLFRVMLSDFISKHNDFVVLISAASVADFFYKIKEKVTVIHILLLDYQLPDSEANQTIQIVHEQFPNIKIVILTVFIHPHLIEEMLRLGVAGFLSKGIKPDLFFNALKNIYAGAVVVENDGSLLTDFAYKEKELYHTDNIMHLSEKEIHFLKLCLNDEYTYKMIAHKLKISPKTLDKYRENLFKKLNVKSKAGLAIYAIRRGLAK